MTFIFLSYLNSLLFILQTIGFYEITLEDLIYNVFSSSSSVHWSQHHTTHCPKIFVCLIFFFKHRLVKFWGKDPYLWTVQELLSKSLFPLHNHPLLVTDCWLWHRGLWEVVYYTINIKWCLSLFCAAITKYLRLGNLYRIEIYFLQQLKSLFLSVTWTQHIGVHMRRWSLCWVIPRWKVEGQKEEVKEGRKGRGSHSFLHQASIHSCDN